MEMVSCRKRTKTEAIEGNMGKPLHGDNMCILHVCLGVVIANVGSGILGLDILVSSGRVDTAESRSCKIYLAIIFLLIVVVTRKLLLATSTLLSSRSGRSWHESAVMFSELVHQFHYLFVFWIRLIHSPDFHVLITTEDHEVSIAKHSGRRNFHRAMVLVVIPNV